MAFKEGMLHTIAIYLAMLAGVFVAGLALVILDPFEGASRWLNKFVDPPFWSPLLICGVVTGVILNRRRLLQPNYGYALILPSFLLLLSICTEGISMKAWISLNEMYFSSNSGATEGLYKLFYTAPVYTAVAYCVGCAISNYHAKRKANASP